MVKRKETRQKKYVPNAGPGHLRVLLKGSAFEPGHAAGYYRPGTKVHDADALDLPAVQRGWESVKRELLPKWIAENPGTRPWAWWKFDAPEERRQQLHGPGLLFVDSPRCPPKGRKWWFGIPAVTGGADHIEGVIFESEAAYLERHGLLTATEGKQLGRNFPRQTVIVLPMS